MIYLLFILLSAISKAICDLIKFKAYPKGNWWLAKGRFSWDKRSVWTKGVFSFLSDGWHFFDAVRNMSFIIVVIMLLGVQWYYCILGYALFGGGFNLLYKLKG